MKCSYCRQASNQTDSHGNCPACGAEYIRADFSARSKLYDAMSVPYTEAPTPMVSGIETSTSYMSTEEVTPHLEPTTEPITTAQKIKEWFGLE